MKAKFHLLALAAVAILSFAIVSCSDDDFGPSIFDTDASDQLDKSSYTFALDTFIKAQFLEPYNMRFLYKMEDIGSDMEKNLIPAEYDKSVDFAVLVKYLWYDAYKTKVGFDFIREYSPRIIHLIGCYGYNATSGTVTLGEAEGGLKVTLYRVNLINPNDVNAVSTDFFKTMHHEFSHILHQHIVLPTAFGLISNGIYDPVDWSGVADSVAISLGFVTPYASSQSREDWVETIAVYITFDVGYWERMIDAAQYDWETAIVNASRFDAAVAKCERGEATRDSVGYYMSVATTSSGVASQYNVQRKSIQRDADGNPLLASDGSIVYLSQDAINGKQVIEEKLSMCKEWLMDNFDYDLDSVRMDVQRRMWLTDDNGDFLKDSDGNFINRLSAPCPSDPSITFMDSLLNEVYKFEALRE